MPRYIHYFSCGRAEGLGSNEDLKRSFDLPLPVPGLKMQRRAIFLLSEVAMTDIRGMEVKLVSGARYMHVALAPV